MKISENGVRSSIGEGQAKLMALRQMLVMIRHSGQCLDERKVIVGVNLLLQLISRDCFHRHSPILSFLRPPP